MSKYTRPKGVMGGPCSHCGVSQPEHIGKSCDEAKAARQERLLQRSSEAMKGTSIAEIPKRPNPNNVDAPSYSEMLVVHEHAVAVRAVDALRLCMDRPAFADDYAEEALSEIDASGWKPTPRNE